MMGTMDVPMPNTAHPGLERYAEFVRTCKVDPVLLPKVTTPASYLSEQIQPTSISPRPMVLTKHKAAGPAPFVGDPVLNDARYYWWVWTDEGNRHIASDAELVWRFNPL